MDVFNNKYVQRGRSSGFSLLEIVIAIAVTSFGLLGLAGMQATALRNNQSAYRHSQAAVLAYDIADRMRANTSAIKNYTTVVMASGSANQQTGCTAISGTCSAAQMAENDLHYWNAHLQATLPGAVVNISCADEETCLVEGTNLDEDDVYTISISWAGRAAGDNASFQLSFQPLSVAP